MRFILFFTFCFQSFLYAQEEQGKASFYANKFEGRPTASGEKYRHNKLTAAHRTLPFGTMVKVINLANSKSVTVRVNDRGPFIKGRIIDLSKSAAQKLDFIRQGTTNVKIEVISVEDTGAEPDITSSPKNVKYYSLKIDTVEPSGFGIQIGSYQEMENLINAAADLKQKYSKEVTIKQKEMDSIKIYSLIIGHFTKREEADAFRKKIQKKHPDSFIVDYSVF
ncbi:septal ring lytic transglycosylase RlpA family protein [Fulvivirga sp. 29W222]|uniref:Probable endolytic peptidoglycan transglycosylase RlpA n=1 Tax=Fulvivirga marina TaxID=2494733 RepID=A0A937G396_9BACT|nr:septal ring lytic transglycosylase RlpA family protein [Fulvivirga marina]MBL6449887.1 septal ring lytic transglycosylase RlpA family protein [Fulvivirga marina]